MRIDKLVKPIVLILCVAVMVYALLTMGNNRAKLDYQEHLGDTAVTVDSEEIIFQDLAFYILYEEGKIEEQARIYNPDYTKDYWNLHTNDTFIQLEAKEVVLGMAVHDHLFYQMAVAEGMIPLQMRKSKSLNTELQIFGKTCLIFNGKSFHVQKKLSTNKSDLQP